MSKPFDLPDSSALLVVISGPSGVGKDTVLRRMQAREALFHIVVTATTREARDNEIHGRDYLFISTDEFAEMIEQDELLEYALVYGDYKGIPKQQVRDALASKRDVVMRIDVQGAATIKELFPDALLIFLTTATEEELERRLRERKSESPEGLKLRIATARKELQRLKEFDYWVVNAEDCLEETVNNILAIIAAEHRRVEHRVVTL